MDALSVRNAKPVSGYFSCIQQIHFLLTSYTTLPLAKPMYTFLLTVESLVDEMQFTSSAHWNYMRINLRRDKLAYLSAFHIR